MPFCLMRTFQRLAVHVRVDLELQLQPTVVGLDLQLPVALTGAAAAADDVARCRRHRCRLVLQEPPSTAPRRSAHPSRSCSASSSSIPPHRRALLMFTARIVGTTESLTESLSGPGQRRVKGPVSPVKGPPTTDQPIGCPAEASGFLVGPAVFNTVVGARAPRRVRFPSASAEVVRSTTPTCRAPGSIGDPGPAAAWNDSARVGNAAEYRGGRGTVEGGTHELRSPRHPRSPGPGAIRRQGRRPSSTQRANAR